MQQQQRTGLRRFRYVYGWRLRHWWFDTRSGALARRAAGVCFALGGLWLGLRALLQPAAHGQQQAFLWWVQLIIMAVSMLASYMLSRTSTTKPEVQSYDMPTVEQGTALKRIYGTYRIKSPVILAWKSAGTTPIKSSGGKK
jgi:hypothetical protein